MTHIASIKQIMNAHFDLSEEDILAFCQSVDKYITDTVAASVSSALAANKVTALAAKATGGAGTAAAGASKPRAPRAKKATDGSSDGAPKPYPTFVKIISHFTKNQIDITNAVTISDNFSNKSSTSYGIFTGSLQHTVGTSLTFKELVEAVTRAATDASETGKAPGIMVLAGICWGMLDDSSRAQIVALPL